MNFSIFDFSYILVDLLKKTLNVHKIMKNEFKHIILSLIYVTYIRTIDLT